MVLLTGLVAVGVAVNTAVVFGFGIAVVAAVAIVVAVILSFAVAIDVGVTDFVFGDNVASEIVVEFFPAKKEWPCVSVKMLNLCWTLSWHQDRDK